MRKKTKDILDVVEIPTGDSWIFKAEMHRAHHEAKRETFDGTYGSAVIDRIANKKHIHLRLVNDSLTDKDRESIVMSAWINSRSLFRPYEVTLYINSDLLSVDDTSYKKIKNMLFPINFKKAITLLNYEHDDTLKTLSRIVVLNKIDRSWLK